MNGKIKNVQHLSSSQYATAAKLRARWNLYKFSIPKIDIHQTGIEHLHLKGDENILEVGCGDGGVLINLRRDGHKGQLVGLEINDKMFQTAVNLQTKVNIQPPIAFMVGSADYLPFPDKSFDVIIAFFMLYHMPDIQKTLREWKRILKDDGKVLITTSSILNKPKHKTFKKLAEALIGKTAPQFNSSFNVENAEKQLNGIFKIIDTFVYEGRIKLNKSNQYMKAFNSIRDMYDPIPSNLEWEKAKKAVRTKVEKEIDQNGFFTDIVRRGLFICRKI